MHRLSCLISLLLATAAWSQVPEGGLTSRELGIAMSLPPGRAEILERGRDVYDYWCKTCHGTEPIKPGTAALAIKYQGALPAPLEERTDLTAQFVAVIVRQGISMMPFFRPTEISDPDLEALSAYLTRNAAR